VYTAGVKKIPGTDYTMTNGVVSFAVPPTSGAAITADFQWLWRVRFAQDSQEFDNFMYQLWECKKVELVSIKQ
jgi:hypothetical protein